MRDVEVKGPDPVENDGRKVDCFGTPVPPAAPELEGGRTAAMVLVEVAQVRKPSVEEG